MKIRYSIFTLLILTAAIATVVGIRQISAEREARRNRNTIANCQTWISTNLDIGTNSIGEYHTTIDILPDDDGLPFRFVQFAHKVHMKDLILENVGIEACSGGFPYYFSINVSEDGETILNHYAESE